jgi:LysM repeat protein
VAPGETLSAIAQAYGARSADIIEANGLQSADMLRVGQKLFIPAP